MPTPPAFYARVRGSPSEHWHDVSYEKLKTLELCGCPTVKIRLFVLTEFTNLTDGHINTRTDGRTPHDCIGRACIASRGKKNDIGYDAQITLQIDIDRYEISYGE